MITSSLEYNETVVDHFHQPRNAAEGPCRDSVCGEGGSAESGTWIEFQLQLDGARIEKARFRAYGCPHTIALASWLTERLIGEKLTSGFAISKDEVVRVLGLPTEKMRSVLVAEDALRACADRATRKGVAG
jgi:NifU-like protein involved in Fe-S cluster formation